MAENGPFGTPFLTPKFPLKKFMWVPFLRSFPGNDAHKLFPGGPKWGVLGGGQKVYVEKSLCAFSVPYRCPQNRFVHKFPPPPGVNLEDFLQICTGFPYFGPFFLGGGGGAGVGA